MKKDLKIELESILNSNDKANEKVISVLELLDEFLKKDENKVVKNVASVINLSNSLEDLIIYISNLDVILNSHSDIIKRLQTENIESLEKLKNIENINLMLMQENKLLKVKNDATLIL